MKIDDVLALAKAGFTSTQIVALAQISQAPATQVPPATQTDSIMAEIQKLTGALQANALLAGNMPTTQQTADDVLASIINPPTAEKK
jgi:alkylhydroperoxidase family enzyme